MARIFTTKWPVPARIEAVLLLPAAILPLGFWLTPKVDPGGLNVGMLLATPVIIPISLAVICLGLLVAADRLLRSPNGAALLSVLAISIWTGVTGILVSRLLPATSGSLTADAPPWLLASIAAWILSMIAHLRILRAAADNEAEPGAVVETPYGVSGAMAEDNGWRERPRHRVAQSLVIAYAGQIKEDNAGATEEWRPVRLPRLPRSSLPLMLAKALAAVLIIVAIWHRGDIADAILESPLFPPVAGEAIAKRGPDGKFVFAVKINGMKLPMTFDADSAAVTLRAEDAVLLGVSSRRLDFGSKIRTAKGPIEAAGITIRTMTVGGITYQDVPGFVARPGTLDHDILGHSFIGRLTAWHVDHDRMILRGAD